jgi:hypothetical protein
VLIDEERPQRFDLGSSHEQHQIYGFVIWTSHEQILRDFPLFGTRLVPGRQILDRRAKPRFQLRYGGSSEYGVDAGEALHAKQANQGTHRSGGSRGGEVR